MTLTLDIDSSHAPAPEDTASHTFQAEGGAIGRDPKTSTWVLSHPKVSGRHAVITWSDSVFYIEDTSRNGTWLNSKRLTRGQPHRLHSGDRIGIEPYDIRVSIAPDRAPTESVPPGLLRPIDESAASDTGELRAFRSEESAGFVRQRGPKSVPSVSGSEDHGHTASEAAVHHPPAPPPVAAPPRSVDSHLGTPPAEAAPLDMARLLETAGVDPARVDPDLSARVGEMLRVAVAGMMAVLQSRVDLKDEFGLKQTRVRSAENNPLKFSANVEDALHNLLVKRNTAYLGPVAAFEQAFADLARHEAAMRMSMRVAFEAMVAAFDADRLQQEFDRQGAKGMVPGKLRYWDQYRERMRAIARDPDASFHQLFGEAFARAYEEQLRRLSTPQGSGAPSSESTDGPA